MKRLMCVALAVAVLAFGVNGCKKAHDTGNDRMSAFGSRIVAGDG